MNKIRVKNKFSPYSVIILTLLSLYVLSLFGLLLWGLMTAVKADEEYGTSIIKSSMYQFPRSFVMHIGNVMESMKISASADSLFTDEKVSFWEVTLYSVLFAGGCAFFKTLVTTLTAYTCARFNFKSSKIVYSIVIIVMMIPVVGNLPSELYMAHTFNLYNHIWGLWVMRSNFLGLYFLVMYNSFKGIPMAYSEAAKVDGANNWQIMIRLAFPMIKGTFLTIMLIYFVEFWNEYQVPLVYLPSFPTLGYTVYDSIFGSLRQEIRYAPSQFTLAFTVVLPILVLFLIFQDKLMGNVTVGGIKG
ncbi:MAG: carbohydrate ABC transporter permease [Clostridia bacterium]|nr:carbohydrate ABC transporter permease [Clostridia bacterium]MBR1675784.1 carbohydrate ABC transporter permease [Clostridia bacterium]